MNTNTPNDVLIASNLDRELNGGEKPSAASTPVTPTPRPAASTPTPVAQPARPTAFSATALPALKTYKDINNTAQAQPISPSEIRVGGHYMIETDKKPLTSVHPDLYIWRCIGYVGTRALFVPAYSFTQGEFVDDEYPKVASYIVNPRKGFDNADYEVARVFDANGTVAAIEEQAKRAGKPRAAITA